MIQTVMGWENRHLYEFTINTLRFADSRLVDEDYGDVTDVKTIILEDVFPKTGETAIYLYDFGDGWKHRLELIEVSNAPQNELLPFFVAGQNACPPEDCGGTFRYRELLEILTYPAHEEYESIVEWIGPKFNPITFNRLAIEKGLGSLGSRIKGYERSFK